MSVNNTDPRQHDQEKVVLLTNRWNLLDILSSGLVLPPSALRKYYRDLAELAGGWLPVLNSPLDAEVIDLVTVEDPTTAFPVALEFDEPPSGMLSGPPDQSGRVVAWATDRILTLRSFRAIHFRTDDERTEHELREYENVVSTLPVYVSPDMFAGSARHLGDLRPWLQDLPPRAFDRDLSSLLDRIAGGILASVSVPEGDPAFEVAVSAARTLDAEPPNLGVVAHSLGSILARESGETEAEEALILAILRALTETDAVDAWNAPAVLGQVKERLSAGPATSARIERNLEPIRLVLRNERDFTRFKAGAGLTGAKAFFLVLMRPELTRLLAWDPDETGATPVTRAVAAFLAGFLCGRTLMSRTLRPLALDEAIRDNVAARLNGEPSPHHIGNGAERKTRALEVDGTPALNAPAPPLRGDLIRSRCPLDETASSLAIALAVSAGWDDCVLTTIETTGEFRISPQAKGRVRISVQGRPLVIHDVDAERLATRVDSEGPSSAEAASLRDYLTSQEASGKRAKGPRGRRR